MFYDERALLVEDEENEEDRFILRGLGAGLRALGVFHCYRKHDSVIRIISARRANRNERRDYERRGRT